MHVVELRDHRAPVVSLLRHDGPGQVPVDADALGELELVRDAAQGVVVRALKGMQDEAELPIGVLEAAPERDLVCSLDCSTNFLPSAASLVISKRNCTNSVSTPAHLL